MAVDLGDITIDINKLIQSLKQVPAIGGIYAKPLEIQLRLAPTPEGMKLEPTWFARRVKLCEENTVALLTAAALVPSEVNLICMDDPPVLAEDMLNVKLHNVTALLTKVTPYVINMRCPQCGPKYGAELEHGRDKNCWRCGRADLVEA
jgi:hypothetical protein